MNKTKLKYYCKDCGKEIHWHTALYLSGLCKSCSAKIRFKNPINNPAYKNGEWVTQHYCKEKGCDKKISYPTWKYGNKTCASCAKKGKLNPSFKIGLPKCKDCNKILSSYNSKYCNKCKGKHIKEFRKRDYTGKNNPMYGKTTQTKKIKYKNYNLRSTWEYKFAKFLDLSGIKYLYEPKRFYMKDCSYLPDFYIPEWDLYIEIKAFFNEKGKKRFNSFIKNYPSVYIKVLMQEELEKIGVLL